MHEDPFSAEDPDAQDPDAQDPWEEERDPSWRRTPCHLADSMSYTTVGQGGLLFRLDESRNYYGRRNAKSKSRPRAAPSAMCWRACCTV